MKNICVPGGNVCDGPEVLKMLVTETVVCQ